MNDFPKEEFVNRISKIQENLEKENIEAIIITSPSNFRYFSGLDSNFWESPTRPWFLVISQNYPIKAIVPSIGITVMEKTFIKNIEVWQSPNPKDEGMSLLKKIIKSYPKNSNIGFELANETHLRMSIQDYIKIQEELSDYNFVDASKVIWNLRKIKSKIEIEYISKVCSIASKVFDNFPDKIYPKINEREATSIFKKELINNGVDYIMYMACASGQGGYDQIISNPTEKQLNSGDILIIDTGSTLNGYFCDFDRNFGFGKINQASLNAYTKLWEAIESTLEIIKPGIKCAEIYYSLSNGIHKENSSDGSVGRMGHGLGLQLTEPPSIMQSDQTILEKNMIITLEPSIELSKNTILVQEENILITEDGYKLLSTRTPEKLPIIN
ncbi:Xaa-Pro peptidase family protein [Pelagibacteraceae bacterium]|nr:Xaa-Pro peptidase family protein [Pelagibacteraceae bacterium]